MSTYCNDIVVVGIVKCELPHLGENVALANEDNGPVLKDSSVLLSCSPGYSMPGRKEAVVTCTCESDELCSWQPDPTNLQCLSMLSSSYCLWNVSQ